MNDLIGPELLGVWTRAVIAVPLALLALLGVPMFGRRMWTELAIARLTVLGLVLNFALEVGLGLVWLLGDHVSYVVPLGSWFTIPDYTFVTTALIDTLSLSMLGVTSFIALVVAAFSSRYLHREPGYARFFVLIMVFVLGMHVLLLAGSYDLLFVGWELVGLSSFLLIAFFHHRPGPVRAALRAMITYRAADVGLLVSGVLLHDATGSSSIAFEGAWPSATAHLSGGSATLIALSLLVAVIGKSALWPLGSWLPRAMEGPTPSSALFYGALSVHAGIYLLLRSAPLFEASEIASMMAIVIGLLTALLATFAHRVQSDVKSALAYATMTQVGLMVVGVGLHLFSWTLVYMIAHVFLRLFQILRTPSALRDAEEVRAALPMLPVPRPPFAIRLLPERWQHTLYFVSLQRHFSELLLERFIVLPLLALSHRLDEAERRWTAMLGGVSKDETKIEGSSRATHAALGSE